MSKNVKVAIQSYAYAAIAAAVAVWANGQNDLGAILKAAAIAVLGPLLQALNPKDSALGVGSSTENLD